MDRIIISPSKYVQGNGPPISATTSALVASHLFWLTPSSPSWLATMVSTSFHSVGHQTGARLLQRRMSRPEIDRLLARCNQTPFDVIIGIGGGKTLDTASRSPSTRRCHVVPTIALHRCPHQRAGGHLHPGRAVQSPNT